MSAASLGKTTGIMLAGSDALVGSLPGLLDPLCEADRRRILAVGREEVLQTGKHLWRQGDLQNGIYLIEEGRIRSYYAAPSGREVTLAYWFEAGEAERVGPAAFGPTALPGNLTREEIVQRYAARSGRAVDDVVFQYVLGLFKVAVIAEQIYFRYRQGLTQDERFAGLGFAVALLAQVAVRAVERNRISGLLD